MENSLFRRNVFKTVNVRTAKYGLKITARNTRHTTLAFAINGLAHEVLSLVSNMGPYMVGASKLSEPMKLSTFAEAGGLGYYLTIAVKVLKLKVPGSGKKLKLKGMTRSEAVVKLSKLAADMLLHMNQMYQAPATLEKTAIRTKKVWDLNPDGTKAETFNMVSSEVKLKAIDPEAETLRWRLIELQLSKTLEEFIPLFWSFTYDTFEVPPGHLFVNHIATLEKKFGKGFFELDEGDDSQPAELEAQAA